MTDKESLQFHMDMGMLINTAHRGMTKRFVHNAHELGLDISPDQWIVLAPLW